MFTDHILAVSELYVGLRELEMDKVIEDLAFEAEPACWRDWVDVGGERLVVKPDAFVRFGKGELEISLFVEVDRASQSQTVIRKKGEVYLRYFDNGEEQRRHGVFPRIVFVTATAKRRDQLVQALSRLDANYWRLFQVQLTDEFIGDVGRAPPP